MALYLRIENVPNLPDGGPIEISITGKRGIDIGRDTHLDWTLPDPTRHISGKHAEIRYKEGGYWLHDVSTNGTFLNAETHRMQAPRRLRTGDRFTIGHYIIAAAVEGEEVAAAAAAGVQNEVAPPPASQDLWSTPGDASAPPPIDPRQLKNARDSSPVRPDFLDWAADVPNPFGEVPRPFADVPRPFEEPAAPAPPPRAPSVPPPVSHGEMDWARGAAAPVREPPPPPPMPAPRRPVAAEAPQPPEWSQPTAPEPRPMAAREPSPPVADRSMSAPPNRGPAAIAGREMEDFLHALARAAGVSEEVFAQKDPQALAEQLGQMLRIVVDNLSQLLNARVQAKRMVRSASHTVIQATENNPLKFSPSAEEALRVMFGPPTRSYLDANQALLRGFDDIKTHQIKTYAAMQRALAALITEFDPQTIEKDTEADRGIAAVVGSRKARLWDAYVARWQAKQRSEKGGFIDAFMLAFAQHYDDPRS